MSKSDNTNKKYKGFRQFIEEEKPNLKKKVLRDEKKRKSDMALQQKFRNSDPKNFSEEYFDEFENEWSKL